MSKYFGVPCVHCSHKFEKEDDVVVCPECGAPHHRACYRQNGNCALKDQHSKEFEWKAPPGTMVQEQPPATAMPPQRGGDVHGGYPSENTHGTMPSYDGQSFEVAGVSAREISAYVGSSAFYFLRQFQLLLGTKLNLSWNWCGFLFRYGYFFYRKMYGWGIALLSIALLMNLPSVLYSIEFIKANSMELLGVQMAHDAQLLASLEVYQPFLGFMGFAYSIFCGLFANKLYLKKVLGDIRQTKELQGDAEPASREYFTSLYMKGRPNRMAVMLLIFAGGMFYLYVGSYLASLTGMM